MPDDQLPYNHVSKQEKRRGSIFNGTSKKLKTQPAAESVLSPSSDTPAFPSTSSNATIHQETIHAHSVPTSNNQKSIIFRVTGLPADKTEPETRSTLANTINSLLTQAEKQQPEAKIGCVPSCDESQTSTALVEFLGGIPHFLSELVRNPLSDWSIETEGGDITFDRHFFGFTQLYPTAASPVTADIIAITGLDGHAYGSWRGKGPLGRMWLRDFFSKDLPNCRTMIYGYNSKLSSYGIDTIMDYGRGFLERIKGIRNTKELRERPLFLIGHSFGGIILAHCLVKAAQASERGHPTIATLYKAMYGILFFGTPHKGLVIKDIQSMIADENQHPRAKLLEQIEKDSELLGYQHEDFKNLIDDRKIVSFYETLQTRRLEKNLETGLWGRTGDLMTAVDTGSSLLHLPDNIEAKVSVNADHSQIVKFDSQNDEAYKTAVRYLKQFEQDAKRVISTRFAPMLRDKPPAFTVPFDRDRNFIGREEILKDLGLRFSSTDSHNRAVLEGLGGVGKSQIAIECAYQLAAKYSQLCVFWIHAGTLERFEHGYKSIASVLELSGWDNPVNDTLELVFKWLSNTDNGRWLLILDNADDIDVFRQKPDKSSQNIGNSQHIGPLLSYIPQTMTGSVLFTTRDRKVGSFLSTGFKSVIQVGVMKADDAEKLLCSKIPEGLSTSFERNELVQELEFIPLAITQAAAYISAKPKRMTVAKYLDLYRQDETNQSRLLNVDSGDLRRDPGVPNSVIRTWQISFDQIKQTKSDAAELLSYMAMLDRQNIPEVLLAARYPNSLDLEDALAPLDEFSFITTETGGESFEMHRLVQFATRKWLEQHKEVERWQGLAMEVLSNTFPNGEFDNWKLCGILLPHARVALKHKLESRQHLLFRASLLYNIAWYSLEKGQYATAEAEIKDSLAIYDQFLENSDQRVLNCRSLFADSLWDQGKYEKVEPLYRQTLAIEERILGKEHPETLKTIHNLATILESKGKHDDAELLRRQTLAINEKILGKAHQDTLKSMSRLAHCLKKQSKYSEAELLYQQTLDLRKEILGKEHLDTLKSMNNLALFLNDQGKHDKAELLYRQTLDLQKEFLGKEHPSTLKSMKNLAHCLEKQSKYSEAELLYRQTLDLRKEILGKEHPSTLRSINYLALCLEKQSKYSEAELLYRQTLDLRKEILGKEHPDTLASMNNLALFLDERGHYDESELLYQQILNLRKEILGKEHPDTLASMNRLALCLDNQGKHDEAELLYRQTLGLREEILGKEHLDTLKSMNNLALFLDERGHYDEAELLYRQTFDLREEFLGKEHSDTLESMNNIAVFFQERSRYDEAKQFYQQLAILSKKVLVKDNSNIAVYKGNITDFFKSHGQDGELDAVLASFEEARTGSNIQ